MRLFVDVTAHGWGHLSQTAPIIAALRARIPEFECVARSGLPRTLVEKRLGPLVQFHTSESDFGLVMASPFVVDREATLARYLVLHQAFAHHVEELAATMVKAGCDAVFSNIGYLALAAGKKAGLPTIACSSLNWSDMVRFYCAGTSDVQGLQDEIQVSYACADLFLRLSPGMPMERFHTHNIECPIARVGRRRRDELEQILGIERDIPLVLCAFGGMMPDTIPAFVGRSEGLAVLGPAIWEQAGVIPFERLSMPYADIQASADVVVSKPGYGIVAELGCLGMPSIMVSRGDWPEQGPLLEWLTQHSAVKQCQNVSDLDAREVLAVLSRAALWPRLTTCPAGAELVADAIAATFLAA
jgi:hypothetical protein